MKTDQMPLAFHKFRNVNAMSGPIKRRGNFIHEAFRLRLLAVDGPAAHQCRSLVIRMGALMPGQKDLRVGRKIDPIGGILPV